MQYLKEIPGIILALCLGVRLVEQAEHGDKDLKTFRNDPCLQLLIEEELLEDADSHQAEVSVAE